MIETVLIIDTETTGLTPEEGKLCEVGAILYSVEHRATLMQVSFLCPIKENPVVHINGIKPEITPMFYHAETVNLLHSMATQADAYVAHNAAFDRQWLENKRFDLPQLPWLCTMEDFRWGGDLRANPSVRDLALHHRVPVWSAHRALTDCIYIAQVFDARPDLAELIAGAMVPRAVYLARVSYENRALAKDAGFRWEPETKRWLKRLTAAEAEALPFAVSVVQ